ncbi:MAG: alpha-N-acetylglucosaminidase TIM-barrel domain-containing protein [Bacteroides sp.]
MKQLLIAILLFFILPATAQDSMHNLAKRVLKESSSNFLFYNIKKTTGKDRFEILSNQEGKIVIAGTSKRAKAFGLNWYLKYELNKHVAWMGSNIKLPATLPILDKKIVMECSLDYTYYLNYCTYGYSMPFWDWERWEKELDLMALNGVNLPLAAVGTEAVWKNTLQRLGYNREEINRFIPGPAFLGWWLMGNMVEVGGPLSDEWYNDRIALQRKILTRMDELGMKPVMPAFFGMVPFDFKKKYPDAMVVEQGVWAGNLTRPPFLNPLDPLFTKAATIFYEEQEKLFGKKNYFSGDPFHEGGVIKGIDLSKAGQKIYAAMKKHSSKAVWVLQGWSETPKAEMLAGLKPHQAMVLDLSGDVVPQRYSRKNWSELPWVWCIINNFGGKTGSFATLDSMITVPHHILETQTGGRLSGIGAIMEGIENNPVTYDLLFEVPWHKAPINKNEWIKRYAERRYGSKSDKIDEAWKILLNTAYKTGVVYDGSPESVICASPRKQITKTSAWGSTLISYDAKEFNKAVALFVAEAQTRKHTDGFEYDLVDFTRQSLSNLFTQTYQTMMQSVAARNNTLFNRSSDLLLQIIDDMELLVGTRKEFLVGNWIAPALKLAQHPSDKKIFEKNARAIITTWTYSDSNLKDYAHREYAGLINDYYKPRWISFVKALRIEVNGGQFVQPNFFSGEQAWVNDTKAYATLPERDVLATVTSLYNRYKIYFNPTPQWETGVSLPVVNQYKQDVFDRMATNGFSQVEVLLTPLEKFTPAERKELFVTFKKKCDAAHLSIWSIHIPYGNEFDLSTLNSKKRKEVRNRIFHYLDLATALGTYHKIILHPSFEVIQDSVREKRIVTIQQELKSIAPIIFKKYGANLSIECLPRTCLGNTSSELLSIMNGVTDADVCLDTNHFLQEDLITGTLALSSIIGTLHVSDYDGIDEKHWIPGKGINNWSAFIVLLASMDYKGPFMFEVSRNGYNDNLDGYFEDMAKSYQKILNQP